MKKLLTRFEKKNLPRITCRVFVSRFLDCLNSSLKIWYSVGFPLETIVANFRMFVARVISVSRSIIASPLYPFQFWYTSRTWNTWKTISFLDEYKYRFMKSEKFQYSKFSKMGAYYSIIVINEHNILCAMISNLSF